MIPTLPKEIKRWLVVDDLMEDAEVVALAIQDMGGDVHITHNKGEAEKKLKENIYDICIVDSVFHGSNLRGEDLIPKLRELLPGLPVLMMSNSPEPNLPAKVLEHGADGFIPKIYNHATLLPILYSAALQAHTLRKLRQNQNRNAAVPIQLFLTERTLRQLEQSKRRPSERLLLIGESGTGKTELSKIFAKDFLEFHYGMSSRTCLYFNVAQMSQNEISTQIFAENLNMNAFHLSAFHRAQGGILILDNIHLLDSNNQEKLKAYFERIDFFETNDVPQVKCIFTCHQKSLHNASSIIPGFLETLGHRELELPNLKDLGSEIQNAISFVLSEAQKRQFRSPFPVADEVVTHIKAIFLGHEWPANFKSLNALIARGIDNATSEERTKLFPSDFAPPSSLSKQSEGIRQDWLQEKREMLSFPEFKGLVEHIEQCYDLQEARKLLRNLMVRVAAKKFQNNKSKISKTLKISRQSLYDILSEEGQILQ